MSGKLIKIYHTETREEYDYLMGVLEKEGYIWWWNERVPTQAKKWHKHTNVTCVFLYDNKTISFSHLSDALASKVPILSVTLPTQQPTTNNVEKPRHYQGIFGLMVETVLRNFIPRYKNTYIAHRIASAIEYLLRAPLKNGIEDIKKAYHCIGLALEELGEDETI